MQPSLHFLLHILLQSLSQSVLCQRGERWELPCGPWQRGVVVVGWRGAQPWLFLWRCSLICAHTWVSVGRLLPIANDVYYKSCSARINFYKINGARTVSLIANPSVSLGKHRDLPCEHGSGSLHLPLTACSLSCGQGLSSCIQLSPALLLRLSALQWVVERPQVAQAGLHSLRGQGGPFCLAAAQGSSLSPSPASPRVNEQLCTRT